VALDDQAAQAVHLPGEALAVPPVDAADRFRLAVGFREGDLVGEHQGVVAERDVLEGRIAPLPREPHRKVRRLDGPAAWKDLLQGRDIVEMLHLASRLAGMRGSPRTCR
jgi:hypothetical protein